MESVKARLEEAFRAGHNMSKWDNSDQDASLARFLQRPSIAALVDKMTMTPLALTCSEHGASAPVPACKHCLDKMQHFILAAKDRAAPPSEAAAVLAALDTAYDVVSALCSGSRRWTMSVPARPDHDPDLLITAALRAASEYIKKHRAPGEVGESEADLVARRNGLQAGLEAGHG